MALRYDTATQVINSRAGDLRGTHRTRAGSNRGQMQQAALSVSATWRGSAADVYAGRANELFNRMNRVETDLNVLANRVGFTRTALADLRRNARSFVG